MRSDWTIATPNPLPAPGMTLSSDATLNELTLSDVTLSFASGTTTYTASVANSVSTTTVTANAAAVTSAVRITSDRDTSIRDTQGSAPRAIAEVDLAEGANVITVRVTAQDTTTTQEYVITVTREAAALSSDATLSSLALYAGNTATGTPLTLTPPFSASFRAGRG